MKGVEDLTVDVKSIFSAPTADVLTTRRDGLIRFRNHVPLEAGEKPGSMIEIAFMRKFATDERAVGSPDMVERKEGRKKGSRYFSSSSSAALFAPFTEHHITESERSVQGGGGGREKRGHHSNAFDLHQFKGEASVMVPRGVLRCATFFEQLMESHLKQAKKAYFSLRDRCLSLDSVLVMMEVLSGDIAILEALSLRLPYNKRWGVELFAAASAFGMSKEVKMISSELHSILDETTVLELSRIAWLGGAMKVLDNTYAWIKHHVIDENHTKKSPLKLVGGSLVHAASDSRLPLGVFMGLREEYQKRLQFWVRPYFHGVREGIIIREFKNRNYEKEGGEKYPIKYRMYEQTGSKFSFVIGAIQFKKGGDCFITSKESIDDVQADKPHFLGKLKTTIFGTSFEMVDNGVHSAHVPQSIEIQADAVMRRSARKSLSSRPASASRKSITVGGGGVVGESRGQVVEAQGGGRGHLINLKFDEARGGWDEPETPRTVGKGDAPEANPAAMFPPRQILGDIKFQSNILGSSPRALTTTCSVYLSPDDNETVPLEFENVEPQWNEAKGYYTLDFNGRVTKPSAKNFLLKLSEDVEIPHSVGKKFKNVAMLFGKRSKHEYACDYAAPLSAFQVFCIGLATLSKKLSVN
mmetsp:Transcript_15677/g.39817  ORF Transcript_15677/g.39817 Transcript_15677/m.39817 type:complete len:639 (-) Transcript_15677:576-2492(-)